MKCPLMSYESIKETVRKQNMEIVYLEKAPKIAIFTPLSLGTDAVISEEPWDDAVILVLKYAEIPFEKIYVDEVLSGKMNDYEWIHLHHEDFTGQFGKFYQSFKTAAWYINHKQWLEKNCTFLPSLLSIGSYLHQEENGVLLR